VADNILTKDRSDSPIDIAAKDVGGVLVPRNMLTDAAGADISPATEATLAALNVIAAAVQSAVEAINGKTPASPATETTLASLAGAVGSHDGVASDGRPGMVMLVRRKDSDAEPVVGDGDLTFLNIDEEGRLKVATKPASYPDITGDITAVQATIGTPVAGGTVSGDISRASNVMAFCTGTFSTVNCTFEGSLEPTGDTNWFTIQAIRSNANTIETATGNLSAQPAYAWEMSVNALARMRVRCTARTSGTQSWRFKLGTYATEPIPGAQASATQAVTLTSTRITTNAADGHSTAHHLVSAATTNDTLVVGSARAIGLIVVTNTNAAARFFKLYNKATAPSSADTPVITALLPPGQTTIINSGLAIRCALGVGYRLTTGIAVNDTGAVGAAEHTVSIFYT